VAAKVVKSSFESDEAVQRLEYEVQVLARFRHSGIAQIYDAVSYDDGGTPLLYFAIEYIPNARLSPPTPRTGASPRCAPSTGFHRRPSVAGW